PLVLGAVEDGGARIDHGLVERVIAPGGSRQVARGSAGWGGTERDDRQVVIAGGRNPLVDLATVRVLQCFEGGNQVAPFGRRPRRRAGSPVTPRGGCGDERVQVAGVLV